MKEKIPDMVNESKKKIDAEQKKLSDAARAELESFKKKALDGA